MKALIFKSEVTKAVYYWNGESVITVESVKYRPLGAIMKGLEEYSEELKELYKNTPKSFKIGSAKYIILGKI